MIKTNFTVLLSVYYKEQTNYLEQSLDSIFNQTILPTEVVLVKDGPLTEELNICIEKYRERYPILKVVTLPYNMGLGKALNEGLKHCTYDLIARMDTDDIAKPNRFEKQLKIFIENPLLDICSSWIDEFEGNINNVISTKKLPENQEEIERYAKHRCPINHPTAMYRKKTVLNAGGYSGFPEDYCLWVKMLMKGANFYNIQESLLYFRFSNEVIKRRGGWNYSKADIKSQFSFYQMGFFSLPTFINNIIIRVGVRLLPNTLRTYIYRNLLR